MMHVYGADDHVLVISDQIETEAHQHAFVQVTIALEGDCEAEVAGQSLCSSGILINANATHQIKRPGQPLLLLLIDPSSDRATPLLRLLAGRPFHAFPPGLMEDTRRYVLKAHAGITDPDNYSVFLDQLLNKLGLTHARQAIVDPRIRDLVQRLRNCTDIEHSVSGYARELGLSASRLSHLFKENTGIPLGRYIVLHKLRKAAYLMFGGASVTDAAMAAGFDSPSHLAATNRRLLGMTARDIRKDSRFLKVSCLHES